MENHSARTASGVRFSAAAGPDVLSGESPDTRWTVTITPPDGTVLHESMSPGGIVTGAAPIVTRPGDGVTYVSMPGATGFIDVRGGPQDGGRREGGPLGGATFHIGGDTVLDVKAGAIAASTINVTGGAATLAGNVAAGLLRGSTVTIAHGGAFDTGPGRADVLEGGAVRFGAGRGTLVINGGNAPIDLTGATIEGYDPARHTIELENTAAPVTGYGIAGGAEGAVTLVFHGGNGARLAVCTARLAEGVTLDTGSYDAESANGPLKITHEDNNASIGVCFLPGAEIATPGGFTPVERIRAGDQITTLIDGERVPRRVVWTGERRAAVHPALPDDLAGYPVRILREAFGPGLPYKDLLVTPEHCVFVNEHFVPARMLVNGRSILFDRTITRYTYHHVETARHTVIEANGLPTESYLDTGNRRGFRQGRQVVNISGGRRSWEKDAAAPLAVSRELVEPIHRRLARRAEALAIAPQGGTRPLVTEPDLRLLTDDGGTIRRIRVTGERDIFLIPTGVRSVVIASRAARPFDTIGPFVDVRRLLGVCVGDITFYDSGRSICLSSRLARNGGDGWYPLESRGRRWTDGRARLALGDRRTDGIGLLAIEVLAGGPYPAEEEAPDRRSLSA